MTKKQKDEWALHEARELAVESIGVREHAALEIDQMLGQIEEAKTVAQAVMCLGGIKASLRDMCYDLDPGPRAMGFWKEHK